MQTIALRFGETFSPKCGTIAAHQEIIDKIGYVWYGKMGSAVSEQTVRSILQQENARILLISSGKPERYWAYISAIQREKPPLDAIPGYYRDSAGIFKTWFKVTKIVLAPKDIMSKCFVTSSGHALNEVSRHSMSPYFIIEYKERETQ